MHHCPECESRNLVMHKEGDETLRHYNCRDCSHHVATVEVPEHYLRELVLNSIKLASLVRLSG